MERIGLRIRLNAGFGIFDGRDDCPCGAQRPIGKQELWINWP